MESQSSLRTVSPARSLAVHHVTNRAKDPRRVHEAVVARARVEQKDLNWRADYRATRPKSSATRPPHETKTRGKARESARKLRVAADFSLLAAAANLARLAKLEVRSIEGGGWMMAG